MPAESPAPGTLRPRGRTERVRRAVIAATWSVLDAEGYAGLGLEKVADAADVAKSTVYRRWRDTTGLLTEALRDLATAEIPLADTGSVDDDLTQLATGIVAIYTNPTLRARTLVLALIAEAVHDPRAAAALHTFWAERNDRAAEAVRRAIGRGELPDDTDPVEVVRALGAPIYYRLLVTHEPVDTTTATRAAATALAAARAGVLR